jgi:putative oxidoreductase
MIDLLFDFFSETLGWGEYVFHRWFLLFVSLFFAILFLQSGIDKIISFSGNLTYFKDHFKKTFFRNQVKFLLVIITFLECLTGGVCFYVVLLTLFQADGLYWIIYSWYLIGMFLSLMTLSCLFLGQRMAQDYAGAVNLGIYFLIALLGFSLPLLYVEMLKVLGFNF